MLSSPVLVRSSNSLDFGVRKEVGFSYWLCTSRASRLIERPLKAARIKIIATKLPPKTRKYVKIIGLCGPRDSNVELSDGTRYLIFRALTEFIRRALKQDLKYLSLMELNDV